MALDIKGPADVSLSQTKDSQETAKGWKFLGKVAPDIKR